MISNAAGRVRRGWRVAPALFCLAIAGALVAGQARAAQKLPFSVAGTASNCIPMFTLAADSTLRRWNIRDAWMTPCGSIAWDT